MMIDEERIREIIRMIYLVHLKKLFQRYSLVTYIFWYREAKDMTAASDLYESLVFGWAIFGCKANLILLSVETLKSNSNTKIKINLKRSRSALVALLKSTLPMYNTWSFFLYVFFFLFVWQIHNGLRRKFCAHYTIGPWAKAGPAFHQNDGGELQWAKNKSLQHAQKLAKKVSLEW